jgi:hypothetical protein
LEHRHKVFELFSIQARPISGYQRVLAHHAVSLLEIGVSFLRLKIDNLFRNENKAGKNKYTSSASSTYVAASGSFSISYGDGSSVSGSYAYDTVTIASLSATSQIFAQTTTAISGNYDVINFFFHCNLR